MLSASSTHAPQTFKFARSLKVHTKSFLPDVKTVHLMFPKSTEECRVLNTQVVPFCSPEMKVCDLRVRGVAGNRHWSSHSGGVCGGGLHPGLGQPCCHAGRCWLGRCWLLLRFLRDLVLPCSLSVSSAGNLFRNPTGVWSQTRHSCCCVWFGGLGFTTTNERCAGGHTVFVIIFLELERVRTLRKRIRVFTSYTVVAGIIVAVLTLLTSLGADSSGGKGKGRGKTQLETLSSF